MPGQERAWERACLPPPPVPVSLHTCSVGSSLALPLNRQPPSPVCYPAGCGLTFLVDLVVQGDGAAAPLDGPVHLLLRARVQGDALPLTSDAAFQLDSKDTRCCSRAPQGDRSLCPRQGLGGKRGAHRPVRAGSRNQSRGLRREVPAVGPRGGADSPATSQCPELPAVGVGCALQESRPLAPAPALTSSSWWPSCRPAFSAREPGLTEWMKLPRALPPSRVSWEVRLSPVSVACCTAGPGPRTCPTDVTDGRKGLSREMKQDSGSWS